MSVASDAVLGHPGPWTIDEVEALPETGNHARYEILSPGVLTVSPAPGLITIVRFVNLTIARSSTRTAGLYRRRAGGGERRNARARALTIPTSQSLTAILPIRPRPIPTLQRSAWWLRSFLPEPSDGPSDQAGALFRCADPVLLAART